MQGPNKMDPPTVPHLVVLLASLLLIPSSLSMDCDPDSCDGGPLAFLDPSPNLYVSVVKGKYSSMNCDATNYCNIDWIKDDRWPYPFDFEYGSSKGYEGLPCDYKNQTLEIRNTQKDAVGNYTCIVSNSQGSIERTFFLSVLDESFKDPPIPTSNPNCTDVAVSTGEDVYLFCEFCVGDKSDDTDLQWLKDEGETYLPISDVVSSSDASLKTQYETELVHGRVCLKENDGSTSVGMTLVISHITSEAFGTYVLRANYTLSPGKIMEGTATVTISHAPVITVEQTVAIVVSLVVVFLLVSAVILIYYNLHLTLQLYYKNRYGKIEEHDGYKYDVFISYAEADSELTFALYLRELLIKQNYRVWMRDTNAEFGETLVAEKIEGLKKSRRCLLVISPQYPTSPHSEVVTELAADQSLRREIRIVPILFGGVSREHLKEHRRLAEIVRVLPCITWKGSSPEDSSLEVKPSETSEYGSVKPTSESGCGLEMAPSNNDEHSNQDTPPNTTGGETQDEVIQLKEECVLTCNAAADEVKGQNMTKNASREEADKEQLLDEKQIQHKKKKDRQKEECVLTCNAAADEVKGQNMMKNACREEADKEQLLDEKQIQHKKKKDRQKEKFEKKVLLKMPPKRVIYKKEGDVIV